jgi:hypothetical protein
VVRLITILTCLLDSGIWVLTGADALWVESDPATEGISFGIGVYVTALFAVTVAPAWFLVAVRRHATTALILAIGFPTVLIMSLVAAMAALP